MNQLARNQQVEAARRRLAARRRNARVPAGARNMNVAGCGGPNWNQGYWPDYPPGNAWTPYPVMETLPETAPPLGPGQLVGPNQVVEQHLAPCGIIMQADPNGPTTIEFAAASGKLMYGSGISSCNDCFQILIHSIDTGSLPYNLIPCEMVDAAIWNTDECFCPMEIGCFWSVSPLTVSFSAFGNPSVAPFLNLTIWATAQSGVFDCGLAPLGAFFGAGGWGGGPGPRGGAMGGAAGGGMIAGGGGPAVG